MIKNILICILILIPMLSNAQFKCFREPITWNTSLSIENYMQKRPLLDDKYSKFYSTDIMGSIEYKGFTYSIGVGYSHDEEVMGYDEKELTSVSLINTITVDSTYWIGNQMYVYHEDIKIYDSVNYIKAVLYNSTYQYTKLPISIKYQAYEIKGIHIFAKFKGNFLYEISRSFEFDSEQVDNELSNDYVQIIEPRKNKFYSILGLGTEIDWRAINYTRNSTIKSASMIKSISVFIGFMVYYQPVQFQPIYKPLYFSFNVGVKLLSF